MNIIIKVGLVFILLGLAVFVILSFKNSNQNKPATTPTPLTTRTPLSTPSPQAKDNKKLVLREAFVIETQKDLKESNLDISLAGENKTIVIIKSNRLSTFQVTMKLYDYLEKFHDVGFEKIQISDKEGNKQDLDLTALEVK